MMSSRLEPPDLLAPSSKLGPASVQIWCAGPGIEQKRAHLVKTLAAVQQRNDETCVKGLRVLEASHSICHTKG